MEFCLNKFTETIEKWYKDGRDCHVECPYVAFDEKDNPVITFEFYETLAEGKFIATYPSEIVYEPYNAKTALHTKLLFPAFRMDAGKPNGY